MTQYQATQQLHETVQAKAKELGLKVEITGDFEIREYWQNDKINGVYEYCIGKGEWYRGVQTQEFQPTSEDIEVGNEKVVRYVSIREPQLKQIFVAFEEKLSKNKEKINLQVASDIYDDLEKIANLSDLKLAQISALLEKFTKPKSQAEALYQKYCYDYPQSGFKKDPVKALLEVDEIIKNLK
jgi:hypothetical protein